MNLSIFFQSLFARNKNPRKKEEEINFKMEAERINRKTSVDFKKRHAYFKMFCEIKFTHHLKSIRNQCINYIKFELRYSLMRWKV